MPSLCNWVIKILHKSLRKKWQEQQQQLLQKYRVRIDLFSFWSVWVGWGWGEGLWCWFLFLVSKPKSGWVCVCDGVLWQRNAIKIYMLIKPQKPILKNWSFCFVRGDRGGSKRGRNEKRFFDYLKVEYVGIVLDCHLRPWTILTLKIQYELLLINCRHVRKLSIFVCSTVVNICKIYQNNKNTFSWNDNHWIN